MFKNLYQCTIDRFHVAYELPAAVWPMILTDGITLGGYMIYVSICHRKLVNFRKMKTTKIEAVVVSESHLSRAVMRF